ncbi:MAG: two-component system response regulator [Candidatus Accumulibacter sp.]|uniref:HD-GYP domain-containing protein n=1 Tax=Accumulibacter sp. TaxID=2053492 RepID=UPI001D956033|nr:two-component system response regulator [Accumulibacter sp.]MCB1942342.1 two-component system response regulator [Accumulibacter sp.]MCP5247696.1 two-component system response regulator [Accumulibacter sp.]
MATVLIVDDTPENLSVLSGVLSPEHRIRAVNSGQRALQAAAGRPRPDLILLDVMMPEMDGYEVLARLQANTTTADIPVIFVTALDSGDDEERGLALGAVDYIVKPIRPAIVIARVRAHLELKAARDLLQDRNSSLQLEISRRMAENLMIQDVSIRALARLAEIRDPETGNHLRRTQGYVRTLATQLCSDARFAAFLTPHNIEILVKSAPLHDIGKVGIPDHILLKPGKLTSDEWLIMQTHSRLGYLAIEQAEQDAEQPIEFLGMAKEVAHYHHEKWDGSGYPEGLAGEAIPISARLMALADVFDALIAQRVYKGAFPLEKALRIIREGRGTHFDPAVVDAFFARQADFVAIAAKHADGELGSASASAG